MALEHGIVWRLTIETVEMRSAAVLVLNGRLSASSSAELTEALDSFSRGQQSLVVDLSGVDYISSAGLRALEAAAAGLRSQGRELVVCGVGEAIRPAFELAGMMDRLPTEPTRERAVARLIERP